MDLKLPALGEGADSGTVVNLFVKEGDQITKDQPILELENEKAVATIPSTATGTVAKIFVKAGDKLSVGQRILSLTDGGAAPGAPAKTPESAVQAEAPEPQRTEPVGQKEEAEPEAAARELKPGQAPAAAPSIRKLARDLGIDLTRVRGSARGGRIVLEDVRAYIHRLQRLAAQPRTADPTPGAASAPVVKPAREPIDFAKWGRVSKKPLSPLRQVIARRMSENWNAVPRVTQFDEADITHLNALRKKYALAYEQKGARLTLTSFALKAAVETLKRHPALNSSLDEATQEIVLKEYYHIGVAVDTDAGLIVPVIRDVDAKSLLELSKELETLAKKARDRKVSGEELKGGTFTISNQGGIGGGHFTPIVNKPEVAILGLGRGAMKAVVREERIEPRLMMPVALSYDHRVIDGGVAARFIVDLVAAFENFKEDEVNL
ncbi:MAG TPA: 2-oxo acid dehydrogenase subunit E2 [Candidatus Binatia bacterium]|jgi:pyruvate dehydrogenase E2 component (dihydrolipoamide acetyltransferase)|nr:2-oxo acid dehydrogenase subunit E2 [Candidatus Binatia bacterium]